MGKLFGVILLVFYSLTCLPLLSYADEGTIYIKANTGWGKLSDISKTKQEDDDDFGIGQKLKPENLIFYGLGAGYYITDIIRTEVIVNNYLKFNYKAGRVNSALPISEKLTIDATTVLLNGFIDFYEVNRIRLFTGAGLGAAMISGNYTQTINQTAVLDSKKFKAKNSFAYALYLGVMANLTSNVDAELSYSFRDLGKLSGAKEIFRKTPDFRGHYISVGFNFNL